MADKIDKHAIEGCAAKGNNVILIDVRLKLLETIGVVNELVEDVHQIAHAVADLITRQQAAAQSLEDTDEQNGNNRTSI